jgi:O-antigen/teichoic acid export membrane protein
MISTLLKRKAPYNDILVGAIFSFSLRVTGAVAGFLMNVLISRYLGPEKAGVFFLLITVVTVLSVFSRFGLDNTVLRYVAFYRKRNDWQGVNGTYNLSFLIIFINSFIAFLFIFIFSNYLSFFLFGTEEQSTPIKFFSPIVIFLSLSTLGAQALQGLKKVLESVSVLNITTQTFVCFTLLLFHLLKWQISTYSVSKIYLFGAGLTFSASFFFWIVNKKTSLKNARYEKSQLFESCIPLLVVSLMSQAMLWSSQLILAFYSSTADIALLSVSQRTASLISFILIALNVVIAPKFSSLYSINDIEGIKELALFSTRLMTLVALPVSLTLVLFSKFVMSLYGPAFVAGTPLLCILIVGHFFNVISGSVGFILIMSGNERDMRSITLFCGSFTIFLSFLLIPFYGAIGAAISTASSLILQNLISIIVVKKRLGFFTIKIW